MSGVTLNPWETSEGKQVWKTEAQYFTWVRGNLRKAWSDYPVRKVWKKESLRPVTQQERLDRKYHPSTKNVGMCVFCEEWMAGSKLECDHIKPSEGCYDYETAEKFLWHCVGLTAKDFQLACKPCHKIVTLADARGISFEAARMEKYAILWSKFTTDYQNEHLTALGLVATNAKGRRAVYTEYLTSLSIEDLQVEQEVLVWSNNSPKLQATELYALGLNCEGDLSRRAVYTEYLKSLK